MISHILVRCDGAFRLVPPTFMGVTPLQHHRAPVLALLALCVPALAQPAGDQSLGEAIESGQTAHNPLVFTFAPYVWAASMDGDAGLGRFTSEVDVAFTDLISGADTIYGLQGHFELGRRPWSVFLDVSWVHAEEDDVPGAIDGAGAEFDVSTDMGSIEFGGTWTVLDGQFEGDTTRAPRLWHVDLLGGGRVTFVDLEIEAVPETPGGVLGEEPRERTRNETWIDPFVGFRAGMDFSENWRGQFRADVGGFGLASDFTWQVVALAGYDFEMFGTDSTFFFGYRVLGDDYEDGSGRDRFEWDVIMHGPILGLSMSF